jgi:RimJ/RimL family protein N-acetyltransferase
MRLWISKNLVANTMINNKLYPLDHGVVRIRNLNSEDIPKFFQFQLDEEANQMAAFTAKDTSDKVAFLAHWEKIAKNIDVTIQTILFNKAVIGNITAYPMFDELQLSYWLSKEYWGNDFTSKAVSLFLIKFPARPIFSRTAFDNIGSQRVLIKNNFIKVGEENYFANARTKEIVEFIFKLV